MIIPKWLDEQGANSNNNIVMIPCHRLQPKRGSLNGVGIGDLAACPKFKYHGAIIYRDGDIPWQGIDQYIHQPAAAAPRGPSRTNAALPLSRVSRLTWTKLRQLDLEAVQ